MSSKKGLLVVLSAPSGCGKDTVFKELCKIRTDCVESISATTRLPREGEIDGVNYFFKSVEEFEDMINNNGLLEYAKYNNSYYGTPVAGVEKAINEGKVCFLIIEVQGAKNIMTLRPDCVSIFLLPLRCFNVTFSEASSKNISAPSSKVFFFKGRIFVFSITGTVT